MAEEGCEYRDSHPEINAQMEMMGGRVGKLEDEIAKLRDARMADFQKVIDKIGEVHEKVNEVAQASEGQNAKLAMYGLMASLGGGALMFVATQLFNHVTK